VTKRSRGNVATGLIDFEADIDIDDSAFVYDGPIATDERNRTRRGQELFQLKHEVDWPSPRDPGGVQG